MISRQHLTSATALLLSSLLNHGAIEAQTITITFEATLNGTSVPLDSVLVENLDAGGDTTIYYPDNLLYLVGTGVEEAPFGDGQFHSIPNPFLYTTDIIVTSTKGEMLIAIHDPLGREVAVQRMVASPGQHQFRYTCGMPGIHFVSVLQNDNHRVVRLLALDGGIAQKGTLSYLGMDGIVKADRALFIWNPGDQLRYTGYITDNGNLLSDVVEEVPMASTSHTFEFMVGPTMACGDGLSFVSDIDGNSYSVVQIGSQCWMASNLRSSHFADGSVIPNVTDNTEWSQLTTAAWSNFDNNSAYDAIHGKLYNWYAAANPNICPVGWHAPDNSDWSVLYDFLGGYSVAGGKLKAIGTLQDGTGLWHTPNSGATNETGFSAIPGGYRSLGSGGFGDIEIYGHWWSTSQGELQNYGRQWELYYGTASSSAYDSHKGNGYCIRCLRD